MSAIVPRDLDVDFSKLPRHWMAGDRKATAIANGVNLLFPWGERFFVRSVKHFLGAVEDPELRAQIKGFFGQEGRHAAAHDQVNEILRAQGFEVDTFLERYKRIAGWVEDHTPAVLRLATTAAAEHYTAILAEGAFTQGMLDQAAPEMRALLAWHAAEEIEHKAVAFDVLQRIAPSYALRILGLIQATVLLGGFWLWGTASLLRQERRLGANEAAGPARTGRKRKREPIVRRVFLRGIRQYIRPSFHPSQNANDQLATTWMTARGMAMPGQVIEAA
jgi:predicted metal-dependent hydrolase